MASRRTSIHNRGFTLIETLIVLGTVSFLIGLAVFINLDMYRGGAFRAEQSTIITMLQTARADALNNVDQIQHGVALYPPDHPRSYVLFEGPGYTTDNPTNQVIDASYPVTVDDGSQSIIVFDQLSGDVEYPGTIVLIDPQRGLSSQIAINSEGRISW